MMTLKIYKGEITGLLKCHLRPGRGFRLMVSENAQNGPKHLHQTYLARRSATVLSQYQKRGVCGQGDFLEEPLWDLCFVRFLSNCQS